MHRRPRISDSPVSFLLEQNAKVSLHVAAAARAGTRSPDAGRHGITRAVTAVAYARTGVVHTKDSCELEERYVLK